MTMMEIRSRYKDNEEVIKKLYSLLKNSSEDKKQLIVESIKKVEKEQELLSIKIRRNVYKNLSRKEILKLNDYKKENENENEIVMDKSNIVISDVQEEPVEKVIKPVETAGKAIETAGKAIEKVGKSLEKIKEEINTSEDNITEVLKTKKISPYKLKDAKVVFDGKYKIVYDEGDGIYEQDINDTLLNHNIEEKTSSYNFNIIKLLKDFDEENGTKLYNKYMVNDLEVVYDFTKTNGKCDKKQVKKIREISKRESHITNNIKVKDNRFKKFRTGLAVVATAGLLLFGGIQTAKLTDRSNKTNATSTVKETDITTEANVKIAGEDGKEIEVTTEEEKIEELNPVVKKDAEVKEVVTEEPVVEEVKEEKESMKVGDTYQLDSVDLYYASTDESPLGDTSYAEECNIPYQASLISVVYNNQVMKVVYNDSMDLDALESICKEKYGDDIKIFINFNELDREGNIVTKNVGWVPKDQVLSKGKVLKK